MQLVHHTAYFSPKLRQSELFHFFEGAFEALGREIGLIAKTIYNYQGSPEYIFHLSENAWRGVFNNSIIRAWPENATTLTEFGVYDENNAEGRYIGRSDLLVKWTGHQHDVYLLFEAKWARHIAVDHMHVDTEEYYDKIIRQANKYYAAESGYYGSRQTFLVAITFQELHDDIRRIQKAQEYYSLGDLHTRPVDFCSLYCLDNCDKEGLWVYGRIYTPDEVAQLGGNSK